MQPEEIETDSEIGDRFLQLERCPHCQKAKPTLEVLRIEGSGQINHIATNNNTLKKMCLWGIYLCSVCGGVISASNESFYSSQKAKAGERTIINIFPPPSSVSFEHFPEEAVRFLEQAEKILEHPDSAIMATSSAIDAMLKEKGCEGHNLSTKIENALEQGHFTEGMKEWANNIRLFGNDSRHPKGQEPPNQEDARQCFEFAMTLGEILFVLPAKVARGLEKTEKPPEPNNA